MIKLSFVLISTCFLLSSCASTHKTEISDQERADLLIDVASADLNEGDPTSALINLLEAEKLEKKSGDIQYLLALTYYQKNELPLALQSARKAIDLKPNFSAAKNTLGKLLLDQGKLTEAEKYLTAAANDLTYREAYIAKTNLGILNFKILKFAVAETWLNKAIFDAGDGACIAYYYRGQINLEKNLLDKANADFNRASRNMCSKFSDAHLAIGKTFLRMKKYDLARAKLLEVQQIFPTSDAATQANEYLREIP